MANRRVPYLYTKRGVFYLQKRVPADLQHRYGRPFIRKSLRTKDPKQANRLASSLVDGLEREWLNLRFGISEETPASDLLLLQREQEILLSDACADYCRMKGRTDDKKFRQLAERVTGHVISLSGDKALSAYTIHDAKAFRDTLKARGAAPTTIKRNFAVVRSIWNLSAREHGIHKPNPFANMHYGSGAEPVKRMPVPIDSIRLVQNECMKLDDDIRWLIALISDTGMRLAEAAGLRISDVHLDEDIPFVRLEEHASRPLKTASSRRDIPLVGSALWAVQRATTKNDGPFLFPRYCSVNKCKADYASNTLNKWMKPFVPDGCVIHSFRHSLRDRLRAC
ncbi:tyrosine-type recombinase/integrase, partial [bacterium]|nr:tyrosine-type recombinase/integrase [bacterium]